MNNAEKSDLVPQSSFLRDDIAYLEKKHGGKGSPYLNDLRQQLAATLVAEASGKPGTKEEFHGALIKGERKTK